MAQEKFLGDIISGIGSLFGGGSSSGGLGGTLANLAGGLLGNSASQALSRRDLERLMDMQEESYQRNTFQDLYSPFGSSTWDRTDDGRWIQNQAYSDDVAPLFDMALSRTTEGYGDVDPFQFRPEGLETLMANYMARQGDRAGVNLRPELQRSEIGDELDRLRGRGSDVSTDPGAPPPDAQGTAWAGSPRGRVPGGGYYERPKRRRI